MEQRFADVEPGRRFQEVETALNATDPHVLGGVVGQEPGDTADQDDGDDLVEKSAEGPAAPGPVTLLGGVRGATAAMHFPIWFCYPAIRISLLILLVE